MINFPMSSTGIQYAVVFMDSLTKWREFFATSVPAELLSDRGKAFLSKLLHKVFNLIGMKKVNTMYHPETDGHIERFNHLLLH